MPQRSTYCSSGGATVATACKLARGSVQVCVPLRPSGHPADVCSIGGTCPQCPGGLNST